MCHLRSGRLVSVLATGGLLVALSGCGSDVAPDSQGEAPAPAAGIVEIPDQAQQTGGLEVATARRRSLPTTIQVTGSVTPVEARVAHVRPLARGVVESVSVILGQRVRGGDPLLTFDNIELGERVGEFVADAAALQQAQADVNVRRRVLDRAEALVEIEAISQQELELRQAEHQNAEAAVASRRAELAQVEEQLHRFGLSEDDVTALRSGEGATSVGGHRTASHNVLRAPFSGVITGYEVAPGELVDSQQELLTLTDLSQVWVLADVYQKDIAALAVNREVAITVDSYPDRVFSGLLTYVSDVIDPETRTAKVRCVVDNPEGALKLDMFVRVEIPTGDNREVLTVPVAAVQQIDGQPVVFVRRSATQFERRDVETGETAGEWLEILSGLDEGTEVAGAGSFYLKTALLRGRIGEGE